jgi:hypothetical protein
MSTQKNTRCKRGTRKNKKTGKCEEILYNTCAICLNKVTSNSIKTKCKHQFHKSCLIGWCKSSDTNTCPICRADINTTCSKIMPFNSSEVFRYIYLEKGYSKVDEIVRNPEFDINVKDVSNYSILFILSRSTLIRKYKNIVEYLLQKPNIVITDDYINNLIMNTNTNALALYKKHKKIPKKFKNLI